MCGVSCVVTFPCHENGNGLPSGSSAPFGVWNARGTTMTDGYFVHPSSIIEAGAQIGDGTKIWHFCHIMSGAHIGQQCTLGQNVYVAPTAWIGNNVKIQNNVSVYDGVTLEDAVFVGPSVVFTNVDAPRSFLSRQGRYQKTLVQCGATLGANATIRCGVTIGRYAFVGAGAVVTRDVATYALVYGNPARQQGWVCRCGSPLVSIEHDHREEACHEHPRH